jgi:8-oxo-dGTP pyrophosphatase MutT (NUDIX family)
MFGNNSQICEDLAIILGDEIVKMVEGDSVILLTLKSNDTIDILKQRISETNSPFILIPKEQFKGKRRTRLFKNYTIMVVTCGIYLYSTRLDAVLIGHVTNHNAWSIPKGRLDEIDISYFDCAIRELWEETNIFLTDINILEKHEFDFIDYKSSKKKLKSFLIVTDTPIDGLNIKCNSYFYENYIKTPEFDSYKWIKIDSLRDYVHYAQHQNVEKIKNLIY